MTEFKYFRVVCESGEDVRVRVGPEIRSSGGGVALAFSRRAKLSVYRSIFFPVFTEGQEGWVLTEITRSRIHAAKVGFLRRGAGVSLREGKKLSHPWKARSAAPLRRKEPVGVCWGHLVRMPARRLPLGKFYRNSQRREDGSSGDSRDFIPRLQISGWGDEMKRRFGLIEIGHVNRLRFGHESTGVTTFILQTGGTIFWIKTMLRSHRYSTWFSQYGHMFEKLANLTCEICFVIICR